MVAGFLTDNVTSGVYISASPEIKWYQGVVSAFCHPSQLLQ